MHKRASVLNLSVLPLLALALGPVGSHAGQSQSSTGVDSVSLAGRHGLAVRVGTLTLTTRDASSPDGSRSKTSTDVLGEFSYSHWLAEDWSVGLSVGTLVLGSDTGTSNRALPMPQAPVAGAASFRSPAVTALLLNVGYHPAKFSVAGSLRPHVSLAVGPYVGSGEKVRIGTDAAVESISDVVLGGRVLAGMDLYLGRFRVGLSGGYHFVGEFNDPIRSYRDYSGPEFSLGFGVLLGGRH